MRYFSFIHEQIEVKVLILFVMQRLSEPVTLDVLAGLTLCDDGVGYFDVTDCIADLLKTKHLRLHEGKYLLTAKGKRNGETLEKKLPCSVRIKAEAYAALVRAGLDRDAMIKTQRSVSDNRGYKVALSLSDGVGDIISLELFAANEQQAAIMEKGFRRDAEQIYHAIIDILAK